MHHFYDQLCPACAALNYEKRTESADLRGRVAILTGGRVKIGYQAGIKLLRAGAALIVTTRFPATPRSATRASPTSTSGATGSRSSASTSGTRRASRRSAGTSSSTRTRLDFIVNNACQTVRRPPDFYRHMMEIETASIGAMPDRARALLGEYEGLRGYDLVGEGPPALVEADVTPMVGLTRAAELSQARAAPGRRRAAGSPVPRGPARPGSAAGGPAGPELVAADPRRGVLGGAARDAARQRGGAVRAQRTAEAADGAHARAGQAHRERVGGRGAVLPPVQDHEAPAHQHGEGRART